MEQQKDWRTEKPSVKQLNYAHDLAEQLGVEHRYQWELDYWTKAELSALITGFRKRLGYE